MTSSSRRQSIFLAFLLIILFFSCHKSTLQFVKCTVHSALHSIICAEQCVQHNVHSAMCSKKWAPYTSNCNVHSAKCTVQSSQCNAHSAVWLLCLVNCVMWALWCIQYNVSSEMCMDLTVLLFLLGTRKRLPFHGRCHWERGPLRLFYSLVFIPTDL